MTTEPQVGPKDCDHHRLMHKGALLYGRGSGPWSPDHSSWEIGDKTWCWDCGLRLELQWHPLPTPTHQD